MQKNLTLLFILILFSSLSFAQSREYEIGSRNQQLQQRTGGFYDYSDPTDINIKVSVWGFVRYPGKYVVPQYTDVLDLLSYAGGPTDGAHLYDLRLYRILPDSTQQMIKFDVDDIWWGDTLTTNVVKLPKLKAGDILSVPGSQRYYTRDWISMGVSILSVMISLAILLKR
jgi:hypothetical protein